MCEFCIKHGEGKKWYKNMVNYSREVFDRVNSEENLHDFLLHFGRSMARGLQQGRKWKERMPLIYDLLVYPWLSRRQKRSHFGQIVPVEDVEDILDRVSSVVRLPCICRKINSGVNRRHCYAVGLDLTHIFKDQPDFADFDRISPRQAAEEIRLLDEKGQTHSVWTFETPYIGAICNCERDCMAYRVQHEFGLARVMWKAEYVAEIDQEVCTGCRECRKMCHFGAVDYDRRLLKCRIAAERCYGCGVCRVGCPAGAITLPERRTVPPAARCW